MQLTLATIVERIIDRTVTDVVDGVVAASPRLFSALLIIASALIGITIINFIVRRTLERIFPQEQALVVDLVVVLIAVFLWFGVGLALLKVLGLDEIAASVGTAVGFIALGVSYALSEMIEDMVAGVYLLRDPDFNVGDVVETEDVTGEITSIELRKTRFRIEDGDITILANRNVESSWTRQLEG